jgi:hypothetical protein
MNFFRYLSGVIFKCVPKKHQFFQDKIDKTIFVETILNIIQKTEFSEF